MKIYLILAVLLFSLTFISAAENGVGMGDAVSNTIERANATMNVTENITANLTIANVTYQIVSTPQINRIESGVNNVNENVNKFINSSNQTLTVIQEKVTTMNSTITYINETVTEIRDTPNPESTAAGLILIFGVLILIAVGILIFLVIRKKSTNLYRCQNCNKLFISGEHNQETT